MSHFIGIDIGGTKIAGGVVSDSGKVLIRKERPTPIKDGGPQILKDAIALASELLKDSKEKIEGVGIGAGGQIDSNTGRVFSATAVLPGWVGLPIGEEFTRVLGLKSAVENDVNALAVGEARFGAARAYLNGTVVFLALGTGVGGAILINGQVHHGAHFTGGELGHILLTMDPNARKDTGGAVGTLEAYCSGPGLVQTWREITGNKDPKITGHDVEDDAVKNPTGAGAQAVKATGEYLGHGLVTLGNAFDPDLIVMGGGLAALGDTLLQPARTTFAKHPSLMPGPAKCQIVIAQLGADAAIVGAASLVIPIKTMSPVV